MEWSEEEGRVEIVVAVVADAGQGRGEEVGGCGGGEAAYTFNSE